MAKPQTIVRDGSGTRSVTYQLPPGLFQYIESVLVSLSNGAAVAVRPTLKVETVNGRVMATKRQGESVPAGDTGTATWALRLTDELGGVIRFDVENEGRFLHVTTTEDVDFEVQSFFVNATGPGSTVDIEAESSLELVGRDQLKLETSGAWLISADSVLEDVAGDVSINVGSGGYALQVRGPVTIDTSGGSDNVTIRIPTGASVEVQDAADNPIFRVNENGDLQGKTGKALVFNL